MAREKKPVHKVQMTEGKRNIIQMLLQESMTLSLPKTFGMPSKICWAELSRK